MAPHSFVTQWNADSGLLRVERPRPGRRDDRPGTSEGTCVEFRAVASVSLADGDEVCAVDVRKLPQHVAPDIPQTRDEETVGHAWLDAGWLWIPLSRRRPDTELTGAAAIVLHFEQDVLASLSLRFLEREPTP